MVPIDIWGDLPVTDIQGETLTERDFSVMLGTNFTPSLVFFGPGGNEIFRLRGYYPPYRFRAALEYVAGHHYLRESFRDYLERADPPPKFERDDLNQQDFFMEPPYLLDRSHFSANRPLAVFFEQPSCHACDLLHTALAADQRILHYCSLLDVVQLGMWSDTPVLTPTGPPPGGARVGRAARDSLRADSRVFRWRGSRDIPYRFSGAGLPIVAGVAVCR